MGFWIFMLISNLLLPLAMIILGKYFMKKPPKEINRISGYRTSMSMKNKDTWNFAHHYCGKLWLSLGWIMLILTIMSMLFVIGKDMKVVSIFGGILCGIQLIFLIGSIIPTERALKNNFDQHGNSRK
ncbi:SdpI family protein [Clostridium hydrogeniformans]|uniref:SdpI family protein n=1 Tax=Clostridium hydrogeniformans TaxID=349933 RepID=UPI00047F81DE|nr:SdpI family protein [Clostridium hydrogeniformans]